jgi:hypothetical protein
MRFNGSKDKGWENDQCSGSLGHTPIDMQYYARGDDKGRTYNQYGLDI